MKKSGVEIDALLQRWRQGDNDALGALLPLVYDDLRRLAVQLLRSTRAQDTIQPTALINDVFVRLLGASHLDIVSPKHFFATVAKTMRRVLIDRARERTRLKRGAGVWRRVDMDEALDLPIDFNSNLPALDQALRRLEELDSRMADIIELRFFVGLEISELAALLELDDRTVYRDLAMARAWLRMQLKI